MNPRRRCVYLGAACLCCLFLWNSPDAAEISWDAWDGINEEAVFDFPTPHHTCVAPTLQSCPNSSCPPGSPCDCLAFQLLMEHISIHIYAPLVSFLTDNGILVRGSEEVAASPQQAIVWYHYHLYLNRTQWWWHDIEFLDGVEAGGQTHFPQGITIRAIFRRDVLLRLDCGRLVNPCQGPIPVVEEYAINIPIDYSLGAEMVGPYQPIGLGPGIPNAVDVVAAFLAGLFPQLFTDPADLQRIISALHQAENYVVQAGQNVYPIGVYIPQPPGICPRTD